MDAFTGIDVIEVERIKSNIENNRENFLKKIYTENEIKYCESKSKSKYQSYAGRFAAKEAIYKAVSKMLENKFKIGWRDIEILNDQNGRPYAIIHNLNISNYKIDISISHISSTAVANAIVIKL